MLILVSGSTKTVGRLAAQGGANLGVLLTPKNGNSVDSVLALGLPWAIDNGAYSGFDAERFRWLTERAKDRPRLLWCVCPDVVADAKRTLALFDEWESTLRDRGLPVAFVAQNGQESLPVPWDRLDCLFIGGSQECPKCGWILPKGADNEVCPDCWRVLVEWKLSEAAGELIREAKSLGKWVHMGRVNSRCRLQSAADAGCDSVDGSSMSRFGDKKIHKFCRWARQLEKQRIL